MTLYYPSNQHKFPVACTSFSLNRNDPRLSTSFLKVIPWRPDAIHLISEVDGIYYIHNPDSGIRYHLFVTPEFIQPTDKAGYNSSKVGISFRNNEHVAIMKNWKE